MKHKAMSFISLMLFCIFISACSLKVGTVSPESQSEKGGWFVQLGIFSTPTMADHINADDLTAVGIVVEPERRFILGYGSSKVGRIPVAKKDDGTIGVPDAVILTDVKAWDGKIYDVIGTGEVATSEAVKGATAEAIKNSVKGIPEVGK